MTLKIDLIKIICKCFRPVFRNFRKKETFFARFKYTAVFCWKLCSCLNCFMICLGGIINCLSVLLLK